MCGEEIKTNHSQTLTSIHCYLNWFVLLYNCYTGWHISDCISVSSLRIESRSKNESQSALQTTWMSCLLPLSEEMGGGGAWIGHSSGNTKMTSPHVRVIVKLNLKQKVCLVDGWRVSLKLWSHRRSWQTPCLDSSCLSFLFKPWLCSDCIHFQTHYIC